MGNWDEILSLWQLRCPDLSCPVCREPLSVCGRSLICRGRHTFDIARHGYAAFAAGGDPGYGAALWRARRDAISAGFFEPVISTVAGAMGRPRLFIDAGCGEGSHTARLIALSGGAAIGVDLSREGVRAAAGAYPAIAWAVADLARLPVADAAADAVVNILSPARYDEFVRVLSPGGVIVKVVPAENHLLELRAALDMPLSSTAGRAEALFRETFRSAKAFSVERKVFADAELPALFAMTPLSSGRTAPAVSGGMEVTLSVRVLFARI